jgi:tyrosine-protein kinase Etk/Wzc
MQENQPLLKQTSDNTINIREEIDKYLIFWKWFIISLLIAFVIAFVYLRYTVPQYKATATILVKDERKGTLQSELSAFSDLGLTSGLKNNVDNEIEIIKSRTIIEKAIKKLGFSITYLADANIKHVELYNDKPVEFVFFNTSDKFYETDNQYEFESKTATSFEIFKNQKSLGTH